MWKLTIEDDEGQRTSLDLNQDAYSLGRAEDNDIRLTERNISRQHCMLRNSADCWEIVDDGSYNGTYVNGERVTAEGTALANGDIINLGDYRVELHDAAEQKAAVDAATPTQRRSDRLVVVIGPTPGVEFSLEEDPMTIGRAEEASISINHASVSRLHAELHDLGQSRWEVVDQGSSNGIRINGVELRRGIIEPGDALELGDVRLRFVAAGKFYRPIVDVSQQLPAMVPFEGMTAAAGGRAAAPAQRGWGLILAAALLMGAVGFGIYTMFGGGDTNGTAPAGSAQMAATDEEARGIVEEAAKLAAAGDIQTAHRLLRQRIPEDSPLRESEDFRRIEDMWADEMFRKAEEEKDPERKRNILNEISDTDTVSKAKRTRALELAGQIQTPVDVDRPRPVPVATPGTAAAGGAKPTTSGRPPPSSRPFAPPSSTTTAPPDKFDPDANMRALMGKMAAGSASEGELQQLRALCSNAGNRACRNQANARLKALREKRKKDEEQTYK